MPFVRAHTRRNGARVRAHYRRRRSGRVRRRSTVRRVSAGGSSANGWLLALGAVIGFVLLRTVVDVVRRHPYWSSFVVLLVVGGAVTVAILVSRQRARERFDQVQRDRLIAVTDTMSGAEFEQWFARILIGSGFRDVTVCGGARDRGADVLAVAPDGRRVVVQCKRQSIGNRVGSAAIQRFAGTCRDIHRGEICLLVTNSSFTAGDGVRLARQLGITLVDREALEMWASTGQPPALGVRSGVTR
ncbi:restriction endonuclease [Micromonospora sp. WMMD1120]|uniref:restriction endonuclease n=1 Tax=Micromonospora sp. WMMD1120 TaxID=3016106 RepID=UPI002416DD8F|nr:restriction endonuclease [Micromonospora sp. WMMD1120]MDG4810362.1 restriction endonuclease [Micromonospora sp. WMMD1120]